MPRNLFLIQESENSAVGLRCMSTESRELLSLTRTGLREAMEVLPTPYALDSVLHITSPTASGTSQTKPRYARLSRSGDLAWQ